MKQENKIDIENYKKEIKTHIDKIGIMENNIKKLTLENSNIKEEMKKINTQNIIDEVKGLNKIIAEMKDEIKDLKEQIKRYYF